MLNATRQKAVVKPGGIIELKAPELPTGTEVEVIVWVEAARAENPKHPLAGLTPEEIEARVMSVLGDWEGDTDHSLGHLQVSRQTNATSQL